MQRTTPVRPNVPSLTGLRFIAALLVVIFHFGKQHLSEAPTPLLNIASGGYVSVGLFFVLSGFVLAYTYLDLERGVVRDRRAFFIARFARIYPVYGVAMLVACVSYFTSALKSVPVNVAAADVGTSLGLGLLMLQAWTVKWIALINTPGWSLSAEIFFYLLFLFIAIQMNRL